MDASLCLRSRAPVTAGLNQVLAAPGSPGRTGQFDPTAPFPQPTTPTTATEAGLPVLADRPAGVCPGQRPPARVDL